LDLEKADVRSAGVFNTPLQGDDFSLVSLFNCVASKRTQNTRPEQKNMKTTPLFSNALDAEMIAQIYRGDYPPERAPDLYAALHAEDDAFDPFHTFHAPDEPLELDDQESDLILHAILQRVSPASALSASTAQPSATGAASAKTPSLQPTVAPEHTAFSRLRDTWRDLRRVWLAPLVVGMAALLVFPFLSTHSPSYHSTPSPSPARRLPSVVPPAPAHPQPPLPDILHKGSRDRSAFFAVDLYPAHLRSQDPKKALPFRNNATLHPDDALLFHFVNLRRGYLYLLREDARGRLETLFPFDPQHAKPLAPGKITLKQAEQPMAYVLEPKMIGRQRFWLLHSSTPLTFPQDRNAISPALRKLFQSADHITLFVRQRE
jgi:hypothetical protein